MVNKYLETGTIFRKGDSTSAFSADITYAVRKAVAEHQRLLQGPHRPTAGKRITTLPDETKIITWVNPYGLVPTLAAQVITPQKAEVEEHYFGIIAFIPACGDTIYSGTGPIPFNIETGLYYDNQRDTFASPYVDGYGDKINGLLGTSYSTPIYGVEGDHRYTKPSECGWIVNKEAADSPYAATRNHPGYFGVQNWFGYKAPYERSMDVLSWDGPHSRYSFGSRFAVATYGDRIFHRLKILIELSDFDSVDYRQIMGAGIEHSDNGDILRIIAAYPNLSNSIVAYKIGINTVDGEPGDYFDKYYAVDGDLEIVATLNLPPEFVEGGKQYLGIIRSGFYFNAAGTRAVCTIGTSAGSDKTYLYHFDSETGFSRELVFAALEYTIGEGSFPKPPGSSGAEDAVPQLVVIQEWMYNKVNDMYEHGISNVLTPSEDTSWTGTVRLLPQKQIVCADYSEDQLVYLYYTSPLTEHTRLYSHQWTANFWNWLDGNDFPSTLYVSGVMTSHKAQTHHMITTGDRLYESSDGQIRWSGGATTSSQIASGSTTDEGGNLSPDYYIPPKADVIADPTHPPMYRYIQTVWNGWIYNNPTTCIGEKKVYDINFLDLRSGILCLVEDSLLEEAEIYWLKSMEELQQYYHETIIKKFILINGTREENTQVFFNSERDVPVGPASFFGIDYWFHIEDTFFIGDAYSKTIDTYGLHHPLVEFRGFAQKSGYPGTVLALRNGEDLIYTMPLGWTAGGDLIQVTNWANDTNPQATFFEGATSSHYIANLAFI